MTGFTQVPNAVLLHETLPVGAKVTLAVLIHLAWKATGQQDGPYEDVALSMRDLAAAVGCSERAARDHVRALREEGFVETRRRGQGKTMLWCIRVDRHGLVNEHIVRSGSDDSADPHARASELGEVLRPSGKTAAAAAGARNDLWDAAVAEAGALKIFDSPATRTRNDLWDAVIAEWGYEPVTRREKDQVGLAVKELREVGATSESVVGARAAFERLYPGARFTPLTLPSRWSEIQRELGRDGPGVPSYRCRLCKDTGLSPHRTEEDPDLECSGCGGNP